MFHAMDECAREMQRYQGRMRMLQGALALREALCVRLQGDSARFERVRGRAEAVLARLEGLGGRAAGAAAAASAAAGGGGGVCRLDALQAGVDDLRVRLHSFFFHLAMRRAGEVDAERARHPPLALRHGPRAASRTEQAAFDALAGLLEARVRPLAALRMGEHGQRMAVDREGGVLQEARQLVAAFEAERLRGEEWA